MLKHILKYSWILIVSFLAFTTACDQNADVSTMNGMDDFLDETVFQMQESGNIGRFGCFELVFPITVVFADETDATVNDYEELFTALRNWREANPDVRERPDFVFPIDVVTEDGEVVTVEDQTGLAALRDECPRNFFRHHRPRGHRNRGCFCFKINFPVTVQFPDNTTAEATDRMALKDLVRAWRADNPDATERPTLVFPITVTLADDTEVEVTSAEELAALKESCRDGE